ncbi:MAG TPA: carbohydrate porin [Thermodesulfobacteriota bacterium]|nr:carbohydrate porin [Thermodesulfobacteriota bacterium]
MAKRLAFVFMFLILPGFVFAAEPASKEVEKRIGELEKRVEEIERGEAKHDTLVEELKGHVETISRELEMVDYRTSRIKAMQERVESLTIGGGLSLFLQGVTDNQGGGDSADGSYSADLFFQAPIGRYGNVFIRGMVGQGGGAPIAPGTFSGPNADLEFDDSTFRIVEAWYWTEFDVPDILDRRLELTVGKMTSAAIFDANAVANNELAQFMADIFVNNLALETGGDENGYGPGIALGYRLTSIYNKGLNVKGSIGLFEGDGDFDGVFDRPFAIAELDMWRPSYGLNGNYRIYAWTNNTKHTDLLNAADDELSNKGFGFSLDQQVSNDVTLFARAGFQDEDVSAFDSSFSAGAQVLGNKWRRGNDMIGVAYGFSSVSGPYEDALPAADFASGEHYIEAYYRYKANSNLSISPDIQYVINPGGDKSVDDLLIYALRMQVDF